MWWLWWALGVLALDQTTKWVALTYLDPGWPVAVVPGLNWSLTFNRGVAFSAFNVPGTWQRWVFSSIAGAVAVAIAVLLWREHRKRDLAGCGLALVLGGALGNLVDRVRLGVVIDFIDCYAGAWHWPAFNIADSAICIGVGLLALSIWRESRATPQKP